ncbi:hypothetical protein ABFX02_13G076100 [Erythranthe guttata]
MEVTKQYSRKRRKQNAISIDRLSELPDSVLCHILSFLSTQESVATTILAKSWRYLWTFVPNLIFHFEDSDTINRVLLLRKLQKINTFRLNYGVDCNAYQVDTWITFAVERNVENVDIYLSFHVDLPRCLFTCETLVDLSLENCGLVPDIGSAICLPHLKKLHLMYVGYEGEESLSHIVSGCPVLEELLVQLYVEYSSCRISSPTIKRLMVNYLFEGERYDNRDYNKMEIDTPAVVYLQLLDCTKQYIKCGALTSLTEADIEIFNSIKPQDGFPYSRSVVGFFDRLCNVECLKLDLSRCTEIIDSVLSAWTISFHNLVKLELSSDCCFLLKFLENADNLEILILREVHEEMKGWMEPQRVPACLLSRLRIIKLAGIKGKKHEFEIIRYLLRNAKVLERVELVYPSSRNSVEKMFTVYKLKEILLFERGSKACEVVVSKF